MSPFLSRRRALLLLGVAGFAPVAACGATPPDPMPARADQTGVPAIGLFTGAGSARIAAGATRVRTTGWRTAGIGAAHYVADARFDPRRAPRAGFRAADGRAFRLADDQPLVIDMFGAAGDLRLDARGRVAGGSDDTDAFAAAGAWIELLDGGTLHCRAGARYLVGRQVRRGTYRSRDGTVHGPFAWAGQPILRIEGVRGHVAIEGHGAVIKAAPGYRYGVFDAASGASRATRAPHLSPAPELGFPYIGLIEIQNCHGGFTVRQIELDGTGETAVIGGEHGDLGRQLNGSGLYTLDNRGPVRVEDVKSHGHLFDGWLFRHIGPVARRGATGPTVLRFRGWNNGRQALSLTGGSGGRVVDSSFTLSARGVAAGSPPAAGLDIEAEGGQTIRDWQFTGCRFGGGNGVSLLASVNDAADLRFTRCDIHGANEVALWPGKPGMVFEDCLITGRTDAVHPGTIFRRCRFTDDPALSPFGKVWMNGILLTLSNAANVQLIECRIERTTPGIALYCDQKSARFIDCTVRATGGGRNVIWGRWEGASSISVSRAKTRDEAIDGWFSQVAPGGRLLVNDRPL